MCSDGVVADRYRLVELIGPGGRRAAAAVVALATVANDEEETDADLCAMATTVADHAENVLRANDEMPRRPALPPDSLLTFDACTLLTADPVASGLP